MKKPKHNTVVGIDARPLSYGITGNSRYLAEVLQYLLQQKNLRFVLYSNKPLDPVFQQLYARPNVSTSLSSGPGIFWLNFVLPGLLKKDGVDIFWGTLQLLPLLARDIPMVVNYHDLNFVSAPETMSFANYMQHRILSSFTLARADKVFCLSENTRNDILKFRPAMADKLKVVYPGVKKARVKGTYPYKNFLFVVGTLEPRKNLKTVVDAYLLLKTEEPGFAHPLVIAGRTGWKEKELTEQLLSGELERQGIYFVQQPDDDLLGYLYKHCVLFLFPSLHEGFGLPLLEAMAENKVCVASDIAVFHEILEKNTDFFVSAKDPHAWKEAIRLAVKKPKRKKWDLATWSWDRTGQLILEELEALHAV